LGFQRFLDDLSDGEFQELGARVAIGDARRQQLIKLLACPLRGRYSRLHGDASSCRRRQPASLGLNAKQECIPVSFSSKSRTSPFSWGDDDIASVSSPLQDDGACALGAALLAVGVAPEQAGRSVRKRWPWAFAVSVNCPSCRRSRLVCQVIVHLNDDHRWIREEIGAWVGGIEPSQPPTDPSGGTSGTAAGAP